jgi:hypothetical protein
MTKEIILLYGELILYKILPMMTPLSLLGYGFAREHIVVLGIRYICLLYLYINLLLSDIILRQSIKIRNSMIVEHNCEYCSKNIIWNIQDIVSNILFTIIGTIVFRVNIFLDIYWRSYIHSLPISIKYKHCTQKSIDIQLYAIPFGIINYIIESMLSNILPFEYTIILMCFINFMIDSIILDRNNRFITNRNIFSFNILLKIVWKLSQFLTVGYIEVKKRDIADRDVIEDIINILQYMRNNTFYRFILWKEFQSLDNFISMGKTSIYYREHILNTYDLVVNIMSYLDNNMVKIMRKSKLLHITALFKPFLSSQHKFYIRLFESRKTIEPFMIQFINDMNQSIKNTKAEVEFEEIYNNIREIEQDKLNIIDDYCNK